MEPSKHFVSTLALVLLAAAQARAQCRQLLVPVNQDTTWDKAGTSLDVDGDRLIMAAPEGNGEAIADGLAYVFERGPAGWVQTGRLTAPGVGYLDQFATGVGISGNVAVGGTPIYPHPLPGAGGAWVYEWDGASWDRVQRLRPAGVGNTPALGRGLAVDAGRIVAGAPGVEPQGALIVFEHDGNEWVQTHVLLPDPTDGIGLGSRLAISGNTIVGSTQSELVVVFEFDGASWQRTHALTPTSIPAAFIFGLSLAIDGDTLVAGAWAPAPQPGNVVVFRRAAGNWYQRAILGPFPMQGDHDFGDSVAVEGPRILVGAPTFRETGIVDPGAAFLFELRDDEWEPSYRIQPDPQDDPVAFGTSVGLSGGNLLVGAPRVDVPTTDAGAIVSIAMPDSLSAFCFGYPGPCGNEANYAGCRNSTEQGALLTACGTDSLSADDLVLSAASLPAGQTALLFTGDAEIGIPFGDGRLCTGGTQRRLALAVADGGGEASYGPGLGAQAGFVVGSEPRFQVWYRDPQGPCGSGFNLSNAVALRYAP